MKFLVIPVIYVCFGNVPEYLHFNVEMASRNNPVVIITTHSLSDELRHYPADNGTFNVHYESIHEYHKGAKEFAPLYTHMAKDGSGGRILHETRCLQRWFILRDYMRMNNITRSFFGDGDSTVFVSIHKINQYRPDCDAVINVERQQHNHHWVGAGESSIWSLAAIEDLCSFIQSMYSKHLDTLRTKWINTRSPVVDMSLLWLWWVAHHDTAGWPSGRPWLHELTTPTQMQLDEVRDKSDASFTYSKTLQVSSVNKELKLCNGLDVANRTVFDHQHAWVFGSNFSLNLDGSGVPFVIGPCLRSGGIPESTDIKQVATQLSDKRLYLNSVHYQGDSKRFLGYDVCRVLTLTGSRSIRSKHVESLCAREIAKKPPGMPCLVRENHYDKTSVCA